MTVLSKIYSRIKISLGYRLSQSSLGVRVISRIDEAKKSWQSRLVQARLKRQLQDSEKHHEPMMQWWDKCHADQDDFGYWLTGSNGSDVWSSLNVESRIGPGRVVLNIGVGKGYCTRALAERGCMVHALDISPFALDKVRDCVTAGWVPSELGNLPGNTFDLAISHLVSQHMNDADLEDQIREVVRALKPEGIFAMQFAYRLIGEEGTIIQSDAHSKEGSNCRSLARMEDLIAKAGGQIAWAEPIGAFPAFGSGWYGIHIRKRGTER